jgi:serine/threonine protein kinase
MIGQTISHYRILELLGTGGMGTVYLAEDTVLERRVALKFLTMAPGKQHYRARFLREARSISAISHPNIATIYDYGQTQDNVPYIVMELVKGQTLHDLMMSNTLTMTRALEIVEAVLQGLAEAHQHNIVHRDIKPTNIALNERGEVKVLDFGLAKHLDDDEAEKLPENADTQALLVTQTREGIVIGTPMYLSPEQALGGSVDARSDLFSLGSVLYECVTGQPAFPGRSAADVCAKVIRDDPPAPSRFNPDVPQQLDHIMRKALAKKAAERYQTARALLADLRPVREALWETKAVRVRREPVKTSALRTSVLTALSDSLRRPRSLVITFLACLALAVLAVWVVSSWRPRAAPRQPRPEAVQWYRDGTNALREGTYYKARKALEKAISIDDSFPLAHARLAEALTELEYTDHAKNELLRGSLPSAEDSNASPLESLSLQAINLSLTGESGAAIETYRRIVEEAPAEERAAAYVDLGRAYERNGDAKKAIESFLAAINLDSQHTAAAMRLGALYGRRLGVQNTELALSYFQKAETRYQILNDIEGLAEVFYQRGLMYMTQRKLDVARDQLTQTLSKAEAIDNKYQQIKTRMQMSSVLCLAGDTQGAERYAAEALEFAKANNLESLTASGLITLGNSFLGRGELAQAQKYFERALEVAQLYKTWRSEARALLALASLATQHHGEAARVRDYVERALAIYRIEGSSKYAMQAQALLGHASDQQGDYAAALKAFDQQLQLALQLDDQEQVTLAYEGRGIALAHQEEYARALENFDKHYSLSQSLKLTPNISHALINRGRVLWQMGRYEEAHKALTEAMQTAATTDRLDAELLAQLHLINAQLALSQRQFALALAEGRTALKLARDEFEAINVEAESTIGLAQALSGQKRAGERLCAGTLEAAKRLHSSRLINAASLALATARLAAGDGQGALATALEAREKFKSAGQQDSEWRALLVAALASKRLGDAVGAQTYAALAGQLLRDFQQRLGPNAYEIYLSRPDVKLARQQLDSELGATS